MEPLEGTTAETVGASVAVYSTAPLALAVMPFTTSFTSHSPRGAWL